MTIRSRRPLLATILAVYLLLAAGYGITTPLFETPDEHLHFFTANFVAREKPSGPVMPPELLAVEWMLWRNLTLFGCLTADNQFSSGGEDRPTCWVTIGRLTVE